MAANAKLTYIDIFAGCGGLSLGLHNAGWRGLFAIEKNPMAFKTLHHNLIVKKDHFDWPSWLPIQAHDINVVLSEHRDELRSLEGKVNLVAGGPPCQGFSFAGRRWEHDERNKLAESYVNFIGLVRPNILFFENVRGFTAQFIKRSTEGKTYSKIVRDKLEALGYNVISEIIDFSEFGIPQRRRRFILVGVNDDGDAQQFFEKLHQAKKSFLKRKGLSTTTTAIEALSDIERNHGEYPLPDSNHFKAGVYGKPDTNYQKLMRLNNFSEYPDSHRFANHKPETIGRFQMFLKNYPRNKNVAAMYRQNEDYKKNCLTLLDPDMPSPTLTTLPDDYVHYSEARILTVREFARLQSFNDWYEFKDKYTTGGKLRKSEVPRYSQVGNAIPPLFVEQAGYVLKAMI
jgi:DNA (cytosine-5)-methyltransferase 1